ncbi:MAG: NAD(P)/FAD-dependent oxidoreductase, partial [Stackebrandtia sp.]
MQAIRSYCVAARPRTGNPPAGMAISAGDPAWSIAASGDLLILGGQGHPAGRSGVGKQRYTALESFARKHWDIAEITHRWSAQDLITYDELPMIGSYTPGSQTLYVATGYHKWGLSTGTAAATLLADTILGRPHADSSRFSPHRFTLRSAPRLAGLNAKVAVDLIGDRLR